MASTLGMFVFRFNLWTKRRGARDAGCEGEGQHIRNFIVECDFDITIVANNTAHPNNTRFEFTKWSSR